MGGASCCAWANTKWKRCFLRYGRERRPERVGRKGIDKKAGGGAERKERNRRCAGGCWGNGRYGGEEAARKMRLKPTGGGGGGIGWRLLERVTTVCCPMIAQSARGWRPFARSQHLPASYRSFLLADCCPKLADYSRNWRSAFITVQAIGNSRPAASPTCIVFPA